MIISYMQNEKMLSMKYAIILDIYLKTLHRYL